MWSVADAAAADGLDHEGMRTARPPLHVTVIGGGFAAAELLLALRSLAEERVELELIAASAELPFRVASTGAAFGEGEVQVYDLRRLAADVGASFRCDTVEAVAARAHRVRLASGGTASYDAVVVAAGARATVGVPGAVTFRDHRDAHLVHGLMTELREGDIRRVVFAAPAGVSWTLPLYELSLLTGAEIARHDLPVEVLVVTPERRPLAVFGDGVSARLEQALAERDVRLLCGTPPGSVARGRLRLASGEAIGADRVVAVPRLVGRRIAGVPADWNGFVITDAGGNVPDRPDVFAIGDITAFPIKQGGVATQQADVVAATLARRTGMHMSVPPPRFVLRSQLLGMDEPLYLRAELAGDGSLLEAAAPAVSAETPWWPSGKLFGRHLTPWMAQQPATTPGRSVSLGGQPAARRDRSGLGSRA
jgi:sulfide:quinone oxidoreductase